ncbi:MFS transporter [Halorubrum gandharaense]
MNETHEEVDYDARAKSVLGYSRWWQLASAVVMMALVSPYQYVWSALEGPLATRLDASLAVVGFVFTLYVIVMSLTQFPAGWYRDRHGPRLLTALAGVLAGGGYLGTAYAATTWQLFVAYGIGAVGVGIVYTIAVNTAIKWFPDKRGLTTGVGTMAFGAGSAIFVPYIRANATPEALPGALTVMAAIIAVGILAGSYFMRDPPSGYEDVEFDPEAATLDGEGDEDDDGADDENGEDDETGVTDESAVDDLGSIKEYTWRETIRTWQFWTMYLMFTLVATTGLMITARVVLYAEHLQLTAIAATAAATLLPLASGGGRLVVGGLSDRFPREQVMAVSFVTTGLATFGIVASGIFETGIGYILTVAVAVFFWSAQFSLFPSTVADYYGPTHSSSNYALLYSSKMWGGVFGGGVGAWLVGVLGWDASFLLAGGLAVASGLLALILRPPEGERH